MNRLLSIPVMLAAIGGSVLLGGCGDAGGDTTASDDPASASATASGSPTVLPTDSSSSSSSMAPVLPACDEVWVAGQQLPLTYHGCADGADTVAAQRQPCEMGKPLVTYRSRFWASAGGPVHAVDTTLAADAGWHRALVQCGG